MLGSIKEYKEASGVAPRDGCPLQVQGNGEEWKRSLGGTRIGREEERC